MDLQGLLLKGLLALMNRLEARWRHLGPRRRRLVRAFFLGALVSLGVVIVSSLGTLAGWETKAVDSFLFWRERVEVPDVVLVAIDEEAFRFLEERQPLSRRYLADLIRLLGESGAAAIGLDFVLKAPTAPPEDRALLEAIRAVSQNGASRVVLGYEFKARAEGAGYEPVQFFEPSLPVVSGFIEVPVGEDGIVREAPLAVKGAKGELLPSFPLALLIRYSGYSPDRLAGALVADSGATLDLRMRDRVDGIVERPFPLFAESWRINYAGPPGAVQTFPSVPLIRAAREGVTPAADNPFRGKIVLVGATFKESRDFFPTPKGLMAGVEIHANMVHTLLTREALRPPHWTVSAGLLFVACFLVTSLSLFLRPFWANLLSLVGLGLLSLLSYRAYILGGYWVDFVAPLTAIKLYTQASRYLEQRRVTTAVRQYVSKEVLDEVLREGESLAGERRLVTLVVADLRGYAGLLERIAPEQLSHMLGQYFSRMTEVVLKHRGMVNKFIGDAVMAVFGAPARDPAHALHAASAALAMHAEFAALRQGWESLGGDPIEMGIAIHTGEVLVGSIGSARRMEYTVIGEPVNLAFRLEEFNRELGTSILATRETLSLLGDRARAEDRGVMMKGRSQPVQVFELLGMDGTKPTEARKENRHG